MRDTPDAVVIGAGANGLVAANDLADAGWDVLALEAEPDPGGAVRSGELTLPGFVHDRFSAFYPLGAASPVLKALDLDRYGLRWRTGEPRRSPTPQCAALLLTGAALHTDLAPDDAAGSMFGPFCAASAGRSAFPSLRAVPVG